MNKCDGYRTIERLRYTPFGNYKYYATIGVCNGTKERDECSCGGDRTKCDFYPEVREKAFNEQKNNKNRNAKDCLLVTFDYCSPDVATLTVLTDNGDSTVMLHELYGDKALKIYKELTGKQIRGIDYGETL